MLMSPSASTCSCSGVGLQHRGDHGADPLVQRIGSSAVDRGRPGSGVGVQLVEVRLEVVAADRRFGAGGAQRSTASGSSSCVVRGVDRGTPDAARRTRRAACARRWRPAGLPRRSWRAARTGRPSRPPRPAATSRARPGRPRRPGPSGSPAGRPALPTASATTWPSSLTRQADRVDRVAGAGGGRVERQLHVGAGGQLHAAPRRAPGRIPATRRSPSPAGRPWSARQADGRTGRRRPADGCPAPRRPEPCWPGPCCPAPCRPGACCPGLSPASADPPP